MFSLVLAAAVAVHLVSQLTLVRNRARAHLNFPIVASYTDPRPQQPPLLWRMMGAKPTSFVSLAPTATRSDLSQLQRLFPEAHVVVLRDD
jgi:hypothetical protein